MASWLVACGIPQEEHDAALTAQKTRFDGEMKKMQEAHKASLEKETDKVTALKSDVARLNSSLERVTV